MFHCSRSSFQRSSLKMTLYLLGKYTFSYCNYPGERSLSPKGKIDPGGLVAIFTRIVIWTHLPKSDIFILKTLYPSAWRVWFWFCPLIFIPNNTFCIEKPSNYFCFSMSAYEPVRGVLEALLMLARLLERRLQLWLLNPEKILETMKGFFYTLVFWLTMVN